MTDAGSPRAAAFTPPEIFDDFRMIRLLGRGAMGEVWLGHDRRLDRPVAVKFISGIPGDVERARFLVEARAIARLSHPNVVTIFRAGEILRHPYLVSELIVGTSLAELPRPVAPERLLPIAVGLARGLAAAHRRGVLHRDIKPANVILADDGDVKLLDFGVAKLIDASEVGAPPAPAAAEARPITAAPGRDPDATAPTAHDGDTTPAAAGGLLRRPRHDPSVVASGDDGAVGTPRYMAPELWRGEPASRRCDIYSLGMLLYELAAGRVPDADVGLADLPSHRLTQETPPLASVAPAIDRRFAAIVDRCVRRAPAARFATGDELRDVLEALVEESQPRGELPAGNPYRGLQRFEAEHRRLFFGRDADVRTLVDRVRTDPLVIVAGDSGVGKSSLCLAGVLPVFEDAGWAIARLTPGRQPLAALAAALAPFAGDEGGERGLIERIAADPGHLARTLRQRAGGRQRTIVFVDQLEELCTLAGADEAAQVGEALAALALPTGGVRLLATVRSDFLGQLAGVPGLGVEVAPALALVRPLTVDGLREAVVGPARARRFQFESAALIDTLVDSAARAQVGLPLLSFALAELWETRDEASRTIPAAALDRIGGVGGALARHADAVIGALRPAERVAVRRILAQLVTPAGTRARRSLTELVAADDHAARAGLEALVRGRLVVMTTDGEADGGDGDGAYQIAHEALLDGWDTLREWISRGAERRAAAQRVERAAHEWERLGRRPDGLWSARQLADVTVVDPDQLGPRERAFLAASRRVVGRGRWLRRFAIAAVPVTLALTYGGWRLAERRELDHRVALRLTAARATLDEARAADAHADALRQIAFARYDARDRTGGDRGWDDVRAASLDVDRLFTQTSRALDDALELAPSRAGLRDLQCDVLYERALIAEREHHAERVADLVDRLATCDAGGERRRRWAAPARLTVVTTPAATVEVERYLPSGRKLVARPHARGAGTPFAVSAAPGSYLLIVSAQGHATVRLPLLLRRGETRTERIVLPRASDVPAGFVYVPAGRFLYGSADSDEELRRTFFNTVPLHELASPAYLIGRHEVTLGDWIAWLEVLPAAERAERMPRAGVQAHRAGAEFGLTEQPHGRWRFRFRRADHVYEALDGEPIRYLERTVRVAQDWRRFPVAGISNEDAVAYAAWLAASGRVPGARLCTDHEWERAARGADGRRFPSGEHLDPDDANFDETYGRQPLAFGPDEVGSHPASRSPVGVDDLAGNVWERVRSVEADDQLVQRGGAWYILQFAARAMNRELGEPGLRDPLIGVRVCATPRS